MPTQPNERWRMDFIHDACADGRRFRCLTMVDEYTRECPVIEVDTSLPAARVIGVLDQLAGRRGLPRRLVVDHGPEFISRALDLWAYRVASSRSSSGRVSPWRTRTWRASTAASGTNAWVPTGSGP
jgi:putative transposase